MPFLQWKLRLQFLYQYLRNVCLQYSYAYSPFINIYVNVFLQWSYAYSSFNNIYVNVFLRWKLRLQFLYQYLRQCIFTMKITPTVFLTIFTSMYFYNAKNEEPFDLCSRQTSCQFFVVFWESFRRLQNVWAVWARIYQWIVRLILTN